MRMLGIERTLIAGSSQGPAGVNSILVPLRCQTRPQGWVSELESRHDPTTHTCRDQYMDVFPLPGNWNRMVSSAWRAREDSTLEIVRCKNRLLQ